MAPSIVPTGLRVAPVPNVTRETGLLNLIGRLLPRRLDRGRVGLEVDRGAGAKARGRRLHGMVGLGLSHPPRRVGAGELDTDKHQEDRGSPEESEVPVGRRAANGRSLSEKDNGSRRRPCRP